MKTRLLRRALALLLLTAALSALCPAALAFDAGQYYVADTGLTMIYTVQVAATRYVDGAEALRDGMLKRGFDSFIYRYNDTYRIMCGKFRDYTEAENYRQLIFEVTADYPDAYVNKAWLPEWAIVSFENAYRDWGDGWWLPVYTAEQYYEEDRSQSMVYAVQVAATKYIDGARSVRDRLLALGFDGFIYRYNDTYRIMCGKFRDYTEAENCRQLVFGATADWPDAYVNKAWLPEWAIIAFENVWQIRNGPQESPSYAADQYYEHNEDLTKVFTVQIAATKYLDGAESVRDRMLALGFDCFIYRWDGTYRYRIMCGKFGSYPDAEAYLQRILDVTDHDDAFVRNAWLPAWAVQDFQDVFYGYRFVRVG